MLIRLNKKLFPVFFALFSFACFLSCHKNIDDTQVVNDTPDLSAKTFSSVSGFVTDENNNPVQGASVQAGITAGAIVTDAYGYFEAKDVEVSKIAATVTVSKAGYFKGCKTWTVTPGKAPFFRIKLIPKTIAGTISAASGGNASLTNGLTIALPANPVVKASDNTAYTGNVHVAVSWLNPEAADLAQIMPGDLRGIDETGAMKGLATFGMTAVELTGDAGELLQIASGKKATITMPLSTTLSAAAPSTIPLWYFDENNGLWKQQGSAVKTGNTYVGDVSHFSWWNCDLPNAIVPVTFTIVDANNAPLVNTHVEIRSATPNTWYEISGWTDATGFIHASVQPNLSYNLNIMDNCNGGTSTFTQPFSVTTTAMDLGNVVVPSANLATVTGTIKDCNGLPVTNGSVILLSGYNYTRYAADNTGAFSFSTTLCNSSMNIELVAQDNNAVLQSAPLPFTLAAGANAIGNIQACGGTIQEYMHYDIDGINYDYNVPGDTITSTVDYSTNELWMMANPIPSNPAVNAAFILAPAYLALNDSTESVGVFVPQLPSGNDVIVSDWKNVYITELGGVGDYMSGFFSFSYIIIADGSAHTLHASFRIRRPG